MLLLGNGNRTGKDLASQVRLSLTLERPLTVDRVNGYQKTTAPDLLRSALRIKRL